MAHVDDIMSICRQQMHKIQQVYKSGHKTIPKQYLSLSLCVVIEVETLGSVLFADTCQDG